MSYLALILFGAILFILSDTIAKLRPAPLTAALPLAFASLISLETIVLNCLSLFGNVNRIWLIAMHLLVLFVWSGLRLLNERLRYRRHLLRYYHVLKKWFTTPRYQILFPLLIIIGLTAWLYPPNNYDSMTYHMARVAHWIQNSSVEYYPTVIERQNTMGPGAEYIILFFQLVTGSDILSPFVQFFSFVFLIVSLVYLVRLVNTPRSWSFYIVILASTAPIAIMEASNTKNDLVASLMTIAILISSARFYLGSIERIGIVDFFLIGICFASAYLVKPTSLLVALPFLLVGLLIQLPRLFRNGLLLRKVGSGALIAFFIICVVAGPDIYRKEVSGLSRVKVFPIYSIFSQYDADRWWNPVRVLAHNIPFPGETRQLLKFMGYKGNIITKDVFNLQEDMIGNPYQVSVFIILSVITILLSPALIFFPSNGYKLLLSLLPVASWFFFGIIVKDQGWITRLEMPLFYILPFSFIFLCIIARKKTLMVQLGKWLIATIAFVSIAYALVTACKIPPRPLIPQHFWGEKPNRTTAYYNNTGLVEDHNLLLNMAKERKCNRIGLILGNDSADYPLTWRAMKAGMETRHFRYCEEKGDEVQCSFIEETKDWPCLIFAADGVIEYVPNAKIQWISLGDNHTYYRNAKWEFTQSKHTCLLVDRFNNSQNISSLNDVKVLYSTDKIIFNSFGVDPQILLPVVSSCNCSLAVMRIVLQNPENTTLRLYFQTKNKPYFTEEQSLTEKTVYGDNSVYFLLPMDEIINSIRLDPGETTGYYELSSLEIRSITNSSE